METAGIHVWDVKTTRPVSTSIGKGYLLSISLLDINSAGGRPTQRM